MYKYLQLILIGGIGLVLANCTVIAVGAASAAAGTTAVVATDPRPSAGVVKDNEIATQLKYKYSDYNHSNIYVTVYNGAVLLTGQVPNDKIKESAAFEAKVIPGVSQIYNYLEVRLPQSFGSISTDSYTTTQVRAKIVNMGGVSSNAIKVITTQDVVYLFGILTKDQAIGVANAAASVNGVKKVITFFNYIN